MANSRQLCASVAVDEVSINAPSYRLYPMSWFSCWSVYHDLNAKRSRMRFNSSAIHAAFYNPCKTPQRTQFDRVDSPEGQRRNGVVHYLHSRYCGAIIQTSGPEDPITVANICAIARAWIATNRQRTSRAQRSKIVRISGA